jgi:hypothetical protein
VEGYRRFVAVVGLESAVRAINGQAQVLIPIIEELQLAAARDRGTFALAHSALLTQVEEMASRVIQANEQVNRIKQQATTQEELVKKRKVDVDQAEMDLAALRKETATRLKEIQDMSRELYNIRIAVREASIQNQERVKQIRQLEQAAER